MMKLEFEEKEIYLVAINVAFFIACIIHIWTFDLLTALAPAINVSELSPYNLMASQFYLEYIPILFRILGGIIITIDIYYLVRNHLSKYSFILEERKRKDEL